MSFLRWMMFYPAIVAAWLFLMFEFGGDHWIGDSVGKLEFAGLGVALILGALFNVSWVRSKRREAAVPAVRKETPPDPEKWALDESGEYHRISFRHAGEVLYDKKTYDDIAKERLIVRQMSIQHRNAATILLLITIVCIGIMIAIGGGPDAVGWDLLLGFGAFCCGLFFIIMAAFSIGGQVSLKGKNLELPPPPVPQPGREEVERQKVHGDGRFMTPGEIRKATRAGASGPRQPAAVPRAGGELYND